MEKKIKAEHTAPDTPTQNGGSEYSGKVIITKARVMRIKANLPVNMWLEIYKAVRYISNQTPVKKLGWKTPFEAIKKEKPQYAHMHIYGCRAYPLNYHILKKDKLDP